MDTKILKIVVVVLLLCGLPSMTQAGVVTLEDVTVEVQPLEDGTFQLLFKFDLPQLPEDVNIDYAILSFGVNKVTLPTGKFLEILSADTTGQGATAAYNANPVTGLLPNKKTGLAQIELDLTQLVDLWINGDEKNQGVLVVSHRRISEKAFETGKVELAPQFRKATVKIFYTAVK